MPTKLTKAEFETLPDALKGKFKPEGEDFVLVEEDVEGLKKSKAEILTEKKELQSKLDELEKFKKDHETKLAEADEVKLKEAGAFKELEEKLRAKIAEVEADRDTKVSGILGNLKQERLKNLLVEKGVLPDRAAYALADVGDQFDLESGEQGFSLKLKTGIGDPKEIDTAIEGLKSKAAFLFAANGASGSGASGSNGNGGSTAKSVTRAQWEAADDSQRATWGKDIKVTD